MSFVFLSHGEDDKPRLAPLVRLLVDRQIPIFIDKPEGCGVQVSNLQKPWLVRHLTAGDWPAQINAALNDAALVVTLYSKTQWDRIHVESEKPTFWVEACSAHYRGKTILPIAIDGSVLSLKFPLGNLHSYAFCIEREGDREEIVSVIRQHLNRLGTDPRIRDWHSIQVEAAQQFEHKKVRRLINFRVAQQFGVYIPKETKRKNCFYISERPIIFPGYSAPWLTLLDISAALDVKLIRHNQLLTPADLLFALVPDGGIEGSVQGHPFGIRSASLFPAWARENGDVFAIDEHGKPVTDSPALLWLRYG